MARLTWSPESRAALVEIQSPRIRQQVRDRARVVKDYPNLHPPVSTRSWGEVNHFIVHPFVVVYRHVDSGKKCQVINIIHEDLFVSREV